MRRLQLVDPRVFVRTQSPTNKKVSEKEITNNLENLTRYIFYLSCVILFIFVITWTTPVVDILREKINKV
jgi:hypothetical protein